MKDHFLERNFSWNANDHNLHMGCVCGEFLHVKAPGNQSVYSDTLL
jgi:hypothetical protein